MGVSGVGKTTVGRALAERLGWSFVDADDVHPAANVAKMAAGQPLDERDRAPWLAALHRIVVDHRRRREPLVLACSALKSAHRAVLAGDEPGVCTVHLTGSPALVAERLAHRQGHYMPAALLPSQLRELEPPTGMPAVDVDAPVDDVVDRVLRLLVAEHCLGPGP